MDGEKRVASQIVVGGGLLAVGFGLYYFRKLIPRSVLIPVAMVGVAGIAVGVVMSQRSTLVSEPVRRVVGDESGRDKEVVVEPGVFVAVWTRGRMLDRGVAVGVEVFGADVLSEVVKRSSGHAYLRNGLLGELLEQSEALTAELAASDELWDDNQVCIMGVVRDDAGVLSRFGGALGLDDKRALEDVVAANRLPMAFYRTTLGAVKDVGVRFA